MACATITPYRQFEKGMSYVVYSRDTYMTTSSDESLEALAETGVNWVALIVTWYQQTYRDSSIGPDPVMTPTDESVVHAVETIHRLGMEVMLKPHVDPFDEHWRGEIEPNDVETWFGNYRAFIVHYAELAQAHDVEMFCVGTELNSMTERQYDAYWVSIIGDVRRVFGGEVTYAANWWPDSAWRDLGFLKELNYLGIDTYFPLTDKSDPTVPELEQPWQNWVSRMEAWQMITGTRIVLTEIGYRDLKGANMHPWDWQAEGPEDQQEQADCYEATFRVLWGMPWLQGMFWWAWTPYNSTADYTPWGKLAEEVLRAWYAKPYVPKATPPEAVPALVSIQSAESAITAAIREGRTRGLDQARDSLSQAVSAYYNGDFIHSELLAKAAVSIADASISQKTFDEASSVVNQALAALNSLQNTTLSSKDAVHLEQQAETEYALALQALNSNEPELAKDHANRVTAFVEEAYAVQYNYQQSQEALIRQEQRRCELVEIALVGLVASALIALVTVRVRRRR
jgi:hypothetical protein